jgi:hypothetical protein
VSKDDAGSADRAWFEARAAALAGRRVLQVRYWNFHLAGKPAPWDYGDWHHAVMGVDLLTDAGPSCILSTDTFYPYGVEVFGTAAPDHLTVGDDGPGPRDASSSSRWRARLNTPVTDVCVFWEHLTIGPGYARGVPPSETTEVDAPVAVRLGYPAGPVWMVAGSPQAPRMREVFIPGDEIMVVFTAERMRQIGSLTPSSLLPEPSLVLPGPRMACQAARHRTVR